MATRAWKVMLYNTGIAEVGRRLTPRCPFTSPYQILFSYAYTKLKMLVPDCVCLRLVVLACHGVKPGCVRHTVWQVNSSIVFL
jgi:hypothetical protein